MFFVFADDLTGAAEIAGVGLRYSLQASVTIGHVPPESRTRSRPGLSSLAVISTESRSLPPKQAAAAVASIARQTLGAPPSRLFKKVDSVLRGPVAAELEALLDVPPVRRIILVPCNPGLGRTIRDGRYLVNGTPIHETHFRNDPEHPITSADVRDMLGRSAVPLVLAKPETRLPKTGIIIGEASAARDMTAWAGAVDDETLPAGAAEFFAAVLEARGCRLSATTGNAPLDGPTLVVSGSASGPSAEQITRFEASGVPVLRMPDALFVGGEEAARESERWADQVAERLRGEGRATMTIARPTRQGQQRSGRLSFLLAQAAASLLERTEVRNLWVDGGETAGALVRALGWTSFDAISELSPGAVLLRPAGAEGPLLLLKPGSYQWPVPL